jgi:hypothetical protein
MNQAKISEKQAVYYLLLAGLLLVKSSILKMEAVRFSETSAIFYRTARRHNREAL